MKRAAGFLFALSLGWSAALAGQEYVAVGDSVTAGIGIDPLANGGNGGSCGSNAPPKTVAANGVPGGLAGAQCGYPLVLEQGLSCSDCVDNEGISGERTDQILSRIYALLDAADWDVMIYMAGTNDVWQGVGSSATIKANIKEATRRAAERGIDTVVASVIRLHPNCGGGGNCDDGAISTLRDNVSAVASENSLYFADQWSLLCPDPSCFTSSATPDDDTDNNPDSDHYADAPPDVVGHPDGDGFVIMAQEFEDTIEQNTLPGTPSPTSPSGGTCDTSPTFTWSREGNGNATWYELEVENSGNVDQHRDWYPRLTVSGSGAAVSGVCSGSTCSVTPPLSLAAGDYTWHVRGRSPRGFGSFASDLPFTIHTALPGTPTGVGPAQGAEIGLSDPVYTWTDVSGEDAWALQIDGGSFETVSPSCGGGLCSDDASTNLDPGLHTWRVRAANCVGNTFSSTISFFRTCPGGEITHLDQAATITTPQGTVTDCEIRIADDDDGTYVLGNGGSVTARGTGRVVIANGFQVLTGGAFTADN